MSPGPDDPAQLGGSIVRARSRGHCRSRDYIPAHSGTLTNVRTIRISGTLYGYINTGRLPAYRFGRVIRIKDVDLAAFIDSARIEPGTLPQPG